MKKKYVIIIIAAILLCCLIGIIIKFVNNKKQLEEAIQFFEKQVVMEITIDNSYENINEIQEKIQNMELVNSVRLVSKEESLENFKKSFNSDLLNDFSSDAFKNKFIINFDINDVKEFEKLKKVENDIKNIDGIYSVSSGGIDEFINAYETDGNKGIIKTKNEYKVLEEQMKEYNYM